MNCSRCTMPIETIGETTFNLVNNKPECKKCTRINIINKYINKQ